jgi:septum formation protein
MNPQSHQKELILASTSPYRQALLSRLCLPFISHRPEVDESPLPGESTVSLTERLALAKAESVAAAFPGAFIIGSDQLAEFAGRSIGKPGNEAKAVAQLMQFSNRSVNFHTSVAVMCKASGFCQFTTIRTEVQFRELGADEVRRYVALDKPLDCAGAFRSEAAGPMLLRAMNSSDPSAIIGLPLIAVARILRDAGFQLP